MPSSTLGSETKQLLSAITQGDCPPEAFPVGYDTVDEVKLHCRVGMDFFFFFFFGAAAERWMFCDESLHSFAAARLFSSFKTSASLFCSGVSLICAVLLLHSLHQYNIRYHFSAIPHSFNNPCYNWNSRIAQVELYFFDDLITQKWKLGDGKRGGVCRL